MRSLPQNDVPLLAFGKHQLCDTDAYSQVSPQDHEFREISRYVLLFKLLWIIVYVVVNDISKVICSDRIHPVRPIRFSKSRSAIG